MERIERGGGSAGPRGRAGIRPRPVYPVCLDLRGRLCVVAGGGGVAERKARGLLSAGARVVVVAKSAGAGIERMARAGRIALRRRGFAASDLDGAFLCVAATGDAASNRAAALACKGRGVLVNAADSPPLCDFFLPAVVSRGALRIAVSTGGASPALAKRLRQEIGRRYGPEYGALVDLAARMRPRLLARLPAGERAAVFSRLAGPSVLRAFRRGGKAAARREMGRILAGEAGRGGRR